MKRPGEPARRGERPGSARNDSRRREALERRSFELAVLNDVARALNASVDLPALLSRALEKVAELLGLGTGWVLLLDEDSGEPYLAAAQNLPSGLVREPELMAGWCYCLEAFCDGDLPGAANVGVVACSRLRKLALAHGETAGLRYHASVPLTVYAGDAPPEGERSPGEAERGLKRLGMLNVAGPDWRELGAEELELLRTVGDVLGVAVERARLHARRLEAAQAEERNRLAREIHDTIAQDFSAIAFQLEAAEALLAQGAPAERARASVAAALGLARKGLDETRRSVLDLRAAPLEGRTLQEALAVLAEAGGLASAERSMQPERPDADPREQSDRSVRQGGPEPPESRDRQRRADPPGRPNRSMQPGRSGPPQRPDPPEGLGRPAQPDRGGAPEVSFEAASSGGPLPAAVEVGLYRVAQEALQNALRHADATRIVLRLEASPDRVRLIVQDDGRGLPSEKAGEGTAGKRAAGRFGLVGMRERLRLLGGSFEIESAPGLGTRIVAEVPLARA